MPKWGLWFMTFNKTNSKIANARHFKYPYKRLYNKLINNAKKKNQEISITYQDFLEFTRIKNCHYCKTELTWIKHGQKATKYNLDQKDPNKGYCKENLVPCCWDCNNLKSNKFTYDEFKKIRELVKTKNQRTESQERFEFINLNPEMFFDLDY